MLITRFEDIPSTDVTILYGGSFNPLHISHVLFVMTLRALIPNARLIVAPTYSHAFNKSLMPYEQRLAMLDAVLGGIPGVEVSTIERDLHRTTSYTIDVVRALRSARPESRVLVAVGADIVDTLPQWHEYETLTGLCDFLVLPRVGYDAACLPMPALPEVSSTAIREALERRSPDDLSYLRAYVPARVLGLLGLFR